jgi:hypothetical protein
MLIFQQHAQSFSMQSVHASKVCVLSARSACCHLMPAAVEVASIKRRWNLSTSWRCICICMDLKNLNSSWLQYRILRLSKICNWNRISFLYFGRSIMTWAVKRQQISFNPPPAVVNGVDAFHSLRSIVQSSFYHSMSRTLTAKQIVQFMAAWVWYEKDAVYSWIPSSTNSHPRNITFLMHFLAQKQHSFAKLHLRFLRFPVDLVPSFSV